MNVLSLFDGISCLQVALNRAGIRYDNYYASEINPHAIKVTQHHFPNTIQLGDVRTIDFDSLPEIDFISAGSPCQDISSLNKKRKGLKGEKSSLFYYFLEARKHWPNASWLVENVCGPGANEITSLLKTKPIRLNSSWVVPQKRPRMYWTDIAVKTLPEKTNKILPDLLEKEGVEKHIQSAGWHNWWEKNKIKQLAKQYCALDPLIANCLTARMYRSWCGNFISYGGMIRRLTPIECERLQTLPDGYTSIIPYHHAYEAIGNGWTVDIIVHILKHLK